MKICTKCNSVEPDNVKICSRCGGNNFNNTYVIDNNYINYNSNFDETEYKKNKKKRKCIQCWAF